MKNAFKILAIVAALYVSPVQADDAVAIQDDAVRLESTDSKNVNLKFFNKVYDSALSTAQNVTESATKSLTKTIIANPIRTVSIVAVVGLIGGYAFARLVESNDQTDDEVVF